MIAKLLLLHLLVVAIQGQTTDKFNQEDGYEGPFQDNGCPTNLTVHWLLPHLTECNKFYYCEHGKKVERICAPGTYFNPAASPGPVCDWPYNVDCTGREPTEPPPGPPGPPGPPELLPNGCPANFSIHHLLPHEKYCNKFYYCVFGEKEERICPPGTYFNPNAHPGPVCDWPGNVDCDGETYPGPTEPPTRPPTEPPTRPPTDPPTRPPTEPPTRPPGPPGVILPNGCPANFSVHHLLPHEKYCNKFYYCVFGEKEERTCPPGTYFNPNAHPGPVCDWPHNVDCDGDTYPGPTEPPTRPPTEPPTRPPTEPPTRPPGPPGIILPNGCPANFSVHHLLPHEKYCNKFYYCVFGEKEERTCPPGTYFNPNAHPGPVCDWPHNVDCDGDTYPGPTEPPTRPPTEPPTRPPTEPPTRPPGPPGIILPNGCPANFSVHHLLPHEKYCNKFYYCVFGEKVEKTCPSGTYFNPNAHPGPVCDWPQNVDCDGVTYPGPTEPPTVPPEITPPPGPPPPIDPCAITCNLLPWAHETDCDKFWRCEGNKAALIFCSEGLHFNANTGLCDFICNAGCVRTHVEATAHGEGLRFFVPWDMVDDELRNAHNMRHEATVNKITSLLNG